MCIIIEQARAAGVSHDALIVEVGSAFGSGIFVARHFGHPILGFECRAEEHERLGKQFEGDPQVKIVNACAGDQPGNGSLYRATDSSSMIKGQTERATKQRAAEISSRNSTQEDVRIVTLDDVLSTVDVLKQGVGVLAIDVQGAEKMVLRGAKQTTQRHLPHIMYEDIEIKRSEQNGKLLAHVLAEMGPDAPQYRCTCERDCMCAPRRQERARPGA
jgi:FkbM family methyltransferase